MKANFGLFAQPQTKMPKSERYHWYSNRALTSMRRFARNNGVQYDRYIAEENLAEEVTELLTAVSN